MRRGIISSPQLYNVAVAVATGKLHYTQPITQRFQAKSFSIDRNRIAKIYIARQITFMEFYYQREYLLCPGQTTRNGAQEKTRTSTGLPPQVPETCASTNSATWAIERNFDTKAHFVNMRVSFQRLNLNWFFALGDFISCSLPKKIRCRRINGSANRGVI